MKSNPFNPNSPVNPGMFVGRLKEINQLERALQQTCSGNPGHFMITGERGIGKTSILLYLQYLATGKRQYGKKFNFLILNLDIDANTTQLGLIYRIKAEIERVLAKTDPIRKFILESWSFLQRINVHGVGLEPEMIASSDEVVINEFAANLATVCNRAVQINGGSVFPVKYDGVLLLLDEADNCSSDLHLGSFLKLLLERLQKNGCNHFLLGLAGLSEIHQKLYKSHPSSVRIFTDIQIGRLTDEEVSGVIRVCIEEANRLNQDNTNISDSAQKLLIGLSEGYPHFIQQFGFSAFDHDTDNIIDDADVHSSAFGPHGALELIGNRYYRNDFYKRIQKDSYRQVLRIMAENLDEWVPREKIWNKFQGKGSIFNNAIKALRDRHIILSKEGEKGKYRLQHKGFAMWISLYAKNEEIVQKNGDDSVV